MHQIQFRLGLDLTRPRWRGNLQCYPGPLTGGKRTGCFLPKTPPRHSGLSRTTVGNVPAPVSTGAYTV